jgi:hypothetical protein
MPLSRRQFTQTTLGSLLTYSLLETLMTRDAFGDEMKILAGKWMKDLNDLSEAVKGQKLKQTDWMTKVDELFAKVDLADALKFIDFEKLTANIKFAETGEKSLRAKFPQVEGLPTNLVFGHQIFALGQGRSVVPHGHNNMATAFLILKGDFQGKHFDRLEDTETHMIIRPTIDRAFKAGEHSTVSDFKDNVHWFKATSESAYIFNIHVMDVDPASKRRTGRVYIDPAGEKLSEGRIKARKIGTDEVLKLYG